MTAEAQAGRDERLGRPMLPPPAVAKVGHSGRMPLLQKTPICMSGSAFCFEYGNWLALATAQQQKSSEATEKGGGGFGDAGNADVGQT